ncbi:hypothetical protein KKI23_02720, partial [Patescibacteria group bacterium]|nr:hypothetical protein [Patescibacteria group bacterium]
MRTDILAIETKAKMLCEGINVDAGSAELFGRQNPSRIKRGGLSSGGKMKLSPVPNIDTDRGQQEVFVNAPIYRQREVDLQVVAVPEANQEFEYPISGHLGQLFLGSQLLGYVEILKAPAWYGVTVQGYPITQILTAHNRQLAGAVFESCVLFQKGIQCQF